MKRSGSIPDRSSMWKIPVCEGCDRPNPIMVMLWDELWRSIAPRPNKRLSSGVLCFQCIEKRLERPLALADLKPCAITDEMLLGALIHQESPSPLLLERTPETGFCLETSSPAKE